MRLTEARATMPHWTAADVLALIDAHVLDKSQGAEFDLLKYLPNQRPIDAGEQLFWRTFHSMTEGLDRTRLGLAASDTAQFALALSAVVEHEGRLNAQVVSLDGKTKLSPVYVVQQLLLRGRPRTEGERFPELAFLQHHDADLHRRMSGALSEAQDALTAHAYRAATVVAVFVMEGLVQWWLTGLVAKGRVGSMPKKGLHEQIEACHSSLFVPDQGVDKLDRDEIERLEGQCLMAASLRNLIHADKQQRCSRDVDAGAAHSAMGAVLCLAHRIGSLA